MDRREAERAVLARGWLAAQPAAFAAALLRRAPLVNFVTGQSVFRAEDPGGGVYGLAIGTVGIAVTTPDAGPMLAHVARVGTWFGHGPLFTRGERTLSFRALEPAAAFHVPIALLDELIAQDPRAALAVGALGNANVDVAVAAVSNLLIRRADRRIGAVLLRAAGAFGATSEPQVFDLVLSQAELGEMANASRNLVNRTLGTLEARGWIARHYGRIVLLDAAAIAAFVSGAE